jgi:hypothetical protein
MVTRRSEAKRSNTPSAVRARSHRHRFPMIAQSKSSCLLTLARREQMDKTTHILMPSTTKNAPVNPATAIPLPLNPPAPQATLAQAVTVLRMEA